MSMMRTSNPALNAFEQAARQAGTQSQTMTLQGTATKTMALLVLVGAAAGWVWYLFSQAMAAANTGAATPAAVMSAGMQAVMPWMIGGVIGGLIFALVTVFKVNWAPVTAPFYAICEGLFLGALSSMIETRYPGIVVQAVGLTFGVLLVMLVAYRTGVIKVTRGFALGVVAATGAIALFYLATMVLGMFGVNTGTLTGSGPLSIGISVVIVIVAALNLALDFAFIDQQAEAGAPKSMEWYGAFSLLVTLVWLYLEILRLLSKLRER